MKVIKTKTTRKSKPTIRQMIAVHKLSEIICKSKRQKKVTIARILREAGYSESVARKPSLVTESKGWQELMAEYFPDNLLAEKHNSLLNAKKIKRIYKKGDLVNEIEEDNVPAIKAALDMAYKIKGKYSATKLEHEIDERLEKFLDKQNKRLP